MGSRGPVSKQPVKTKLRPDPVPNLPVTLKNRYPEIEADWKEYWNSSVSLATDLVDIPVVTRLFRYRAEHNDLMNKWEEMSFSMKWPLGQGKRASQYGSHPMSTRLKHLEDMMIRLEDKLGISPLARARLGLEISNARIAWNDVQKVKDKVNAPNVVDIFSGSGIKVIEKEN